MINSNYGFLIYHPDNCDQYDNVLCELLSNPASRRATMVYTRPQIHYQHNIDGMSDFICTNDVQYLIRNNYMHAVVQMRSNDAWAGYRNDYAWQRYVLEKLTQDYNITSRFSKVIPGNITWQVSSLHLYERQFYLLDHFAKTGEIHITKSDYNAKYGS
jgi:thymidylate synthase